MATKKKTNYYFLIVMMVAVVGIVAITATIFNRGIILSGGGYAADEANLLGEAAKTSEKAGVTDLPFSNQPLGFIESREKEGTSPSISYSVKRQETYAESVASTKAHGYIVEFKEKPLIKKASELKKDQNIESNTASVDIQTQKQKLETEHSNLKKSISAKLGKDINNKVIHEYKNLFNGIALDISELEARKIKQIDGVQNIYPDLEVHTNLMDSVPLINADDVWTLNYTGNGVTIAIIDTGIDYTHPDLGGCLGEGCKVIGGYDFVNNDNDPVDDMGHGTHCAGIAAGNGALKGVAPDAKLYAYKVLDAGGSGYFSNVIAGIERAVDPNNDGDFSDHADVISMSLGAYCGTYSASCGPEDPVSQAVNNAVDAGVVAVIAAGNSGPYARTIVTPGTATKAITVGAVYKIDYDGSYWDTNPRVDQITSFSSRGPVEWDTNSIIKPDVVAPGAIICAAQYDSAWNDKKCLDDKHIEISGTSMATPHVAGAAALIKQAHPDWTSEEIKQALRNTAKDVGYDMNTQGYGRVDVLSAVNSRRPLGASILTTGKVGGAYVDILGIANGEGFANYTLYYEDIGKNRLPICSNNVSVSNGPLCRWDIRTIGEGTYNIKLVVQGSGKKTEDNVIMTVINTEITSPIDLYDYETNYHSSNEKVIHRSDEPIIINGTATGYNFNNYTIKWCFESYSNCSSEGITLANNGKGPVINGYLGSWNYPSRLKAGFYILELTNNYNHLTYWNVIKIYVETDLHKGWPKEIGTIEFDGGWAWSFMDQPTLSDVNGDKKKEIVIAYGTKINVVDDIGNSLPGWPFTINTQSYWGQAIMQFGPAAGDINNDSKVEIIVGDNAGYLHVLNQDGTYLWAPKQYGSVVGTPTLADVNDDGYLEILWCDWWGYLRIVDYRGNYLAGWPKYLTPLPEYPYLQKSSSTVSVGDVNKDGKKEIFVVTESCNNSNGCGGTGTTDFSTRLWAFDYQGNILPGWPKDHTKENLWDSNLILADIDQDNQDEILAGSYNKTVYAWNLDGSNVAGWPIEIVPPSWGGMPNQLSVGDINTDGNLEILFTGSQMVNAAWGPWSVSCLFAYDKSGKPLSNFPLCYGIDTNWKTGFNGIPLIGNVDSDSEKEIILGGGGGWTTINGLSAFYVINHDGSILNGFPKYLDDGAFGNVAPLGDIDNDGLNELMVETWRGSTFVYDMPGTAGNDDWPMFQRDAQHTGCYDCDKLTTCTENDGGKNYYLKGTTAKGTSSSTDSCMTDGKRIKEYYCANNNITLATYNCSKEGKDCIDGACMSCTDSDGGKNYYALGSIIGKNSAGKLINETDNCINTTTLKEYYCTNTNIATSQKYDCLGGCSNGICKPVPVCGNGVIENGEQCDGTNLGGNTCTLLGFDSGSLKCASNCKLNTTGCAITCKDSDNGKNYAVLGRTIGINSAGDIINITDSCINTTTLKEYYCNNNIATIQRYNCPLKTTATTCKSGKCV